MNFTGFDVRSRTCGIASRSKNSLSVELIGWNKIDANPISSMLSVFQRLRVYLLSTFKVNGSDCVVSIPSYFIEKQRREALKSWMKSGLNVLRLMHECTAIALSYGFYKDFAPGRQSIVAFVFIQPVETQIAIACFQLGKMEILSHAFDSSLGVNSFVEVLFSYFSLEFKETYKIDVVENCTGSNQLKSACGKMMNDLTENEEASFEIKRLIGNIDVKGFMSREKFDHLCSECLIRIATVCSQAVADAEVSLKGIDAVELVGLSSMIPSILKVVHSAFQRVPNCSLNACEMIAKGCALQCALVSANSVANKYEIIDALPFSIRVSSNEDVLFARNSPFPAIKPLNVQNPCSFLWENFDELVYATNFEGEKSKRRNSEDQILNFELDINGIISLKYDKLKCCKGNEIDADGDYSMKDDNALDHGSFSKGESTKGKSNVTITESTYGAMNEDDVAAAIKQEHTLLANDQKVEQAKRHKNSLEAYVYDIENKLQKSYAKFTKDCDKYQITNIIEEIEQLLYKEGEDESEEVYISKRHQLEKMVEPIVKRYNDEEERQQRQIDAKNMLNHHKLAVKQLYHEFCKLEKDLNLPVIKSSDEIKSIIIGKWDLIYKKAVEQFHR